MPAAIPELVALEQSPVLTLCDLLQQFHSDVRVIARARLRGLPLAFTTPEIAEAMYLSTRSVERDWILARSWLESELRER